MDVTEGPEPTPAPNEPPEYADHAAIAPDVDDPAPGPSSNEPRQFAVLAVIAIGGVLGAEARYGLARAVTHPTGTWPWATLATNVIGSALLGVLMVVVLQRRRPHPLVRPFLGVGVLGGFTTFSTFSLDVQDLLLANRPLVALAYAAASLAGCLAATAGAVALTRAVTTPRVAR
jgi:CrcB protein